MDESPVGAVSHIEVGERESILTRRSKALRALGVAIGLLVLVWLILWQVLGVQSWWIPSEAMEPAIPQGSRVVTWSLGAIERGDIVVIETSDLDIAGPTTELIKRVVAFEGETVAIENGQVLVDGDVLPEPYLPQDLSTGVPRGEIAQEVTVPTGYVYVLGDNRNRSADSRSFGPIPIDSVVANHAWVWRSGE